MDRMYPPILSATVSARFERELHERLLSQQSHLLSTSNGLGSRSTYELERAESEDWETDTYVDVSTAASSTKDMIPDKDEPRGQETEQSLSRNKTAGQRISHAVWSTTMAVKPRTWISLWFLLTIPVIFWDAGYCFMRPRSMKGGDLHWIWKPYELYQEIDYVYGTQALDRGDGFTNAQSFLNIVENFMNIGYLYLAHVLDSPVAPLLGFASAVMTLSKTVLYWLQEYYCGGCAVGHNDLKTLIVYWIIPNGLWLVVPSFIIVRLTKDISSALRVAQRASKKDKSGKEL